MKHLSRKRFLFWVGSSVLLLTFSCVRQPVQTAAAPGSETVVATLFRVEGQVNTQSIHGIRAYLQVDSSGHFMVNLLTAMNSPLSTVFFDGKMLTVVDYRSKAVLVDKTAPFEIGGSIPIQLDIGALAGFYREALHSKDGFTRSFSWGKLVQTSKLRIVALFNNGSRLLLTPLSDPVSRKGSRLSLKVPPGYRRLNETD